MKAPSWLISILAGVVLWVFFVALLFVSFVQA